MGLLFTKLISCSLGENSITVHSNLNAVERNTKWNNNSYYWNKTYNNAHFLSNKKAYFDKGNNLKDLLNGIEHTKKDHCA